MDKIMKQSTRESDLNTALGKDTNTITLSALHKQCRMG